MFNPQSTFFYLRRFVPFGFSSFDFLSIDLFLPSAFFTSAFCRSTLLVKKKIRFNHLWERPAILGIKFVNFYRYGNCCSRDSIYVHQYVPPSGEIFCVNIYINRCWTNWLVRLIKLGASSVRSILKRSNTDRCQVLVLYSSVTWAWGWGEQWDRWDHCSCRRGTAESSSIQTWMQVKILMTIAHRHPLPRKIIIYQLSTRKLCSCNQRYIYWRLGPHSNYQSISLRDVWNGENKAGKSERKRKKGKDKRELKVKR